MKSSNLLIIGLLAYLYFRNKPSPFVGPVFVGPIDPNPGGGGGTVQGPGGLTWVQCSDPNADQTLCNQMTISL
jgi:hypothetical protein